MTVSFFKQAHTAFDAGNYERAANLYEQAMFERPELAAAYRINLERAWAKMGRTIAEDMPAPVREGAVVLDDLYREVAQAVERLPTSPAAQPDILATVVMTAHNVAPYIEQSVTSVMRQTHHPLEIIVVDDASTDDTYRILRRLASEYPIVLRRLNANLGTYFAKNVGVRLAQGQFVFFQDGDDLCHPERIRLGLRELLQPGTVCVQGSYSRVLFPSGRVLPVNGLVKKAGLITLGVSRTVFDEIGYFNCTTKASDDEFFQRLQAFYGKRPGAVRGLDLPLYYNTLREGSLFADMIANNPETDGCIEQRPSPVRQQYVDTFQRLHQDKPSHEFRSYFQFPVTRDLIKVAPEMTRLANPDIPVVASLCSIPERRDKLERVLISMAPQVDELHVYLDRYESPPDFLRDCHPRVTIRLSRQLPGLRDNGKFVPLLEREQECYFFTVDDDIEYPPDYVNALVKKIEWYGRLAVVGVHGVLIPERPAGYFSGFRRVHWFGAELEQDQLVNNLGTGTTAFHSSLLTGLDYRQFKHAGMVDLYLAALCKTRAVPMIAVSRPPRWLMEIETPHDPQHPVTPTLFTEGCSNDAKQAQLVCQHAPWGYKAIIQAVEKATRRDASEEAKARLRSLLPRLPQCLW
ncbi:glycosyltransferase [Desulfonatronum parangueonense]